MGSFLAELFRDLVSYLDKFFLWCWSLPETVFYWVVDFIIWVKVESYTLAINFCLDSLDGLNSLFPNFNFEKSFFLETLSKVNVFLPIDDFVGIGVFLLETWISVKIFRLTSYLYMTFLFPKTIVTPKGG